MGLSHDYIVMNSSKGFFCLPEVNYDTLHAVYLMSAVPFVGKLEAQFSSWLGGASKVR